MSILSFWLAAAFSLKYVLVVCLAWLINERLKDRLGSILGAWLVTQLFISFLLLALSSANAMTGTNLWICVAASTICAGVYVPVRSRRSGIGANNPLLAVMEMTASEKIAVLGLATIAAALFYRSLYFFDTTPSGLALYLPRVFIWAVSKSLFVSAPAQPSLLFAAEWNGELNALFYVLLAGSDQAISFGNVEVWCISALGFAWVVHQFGLGRRLALALACLVASTPAFIGLTFTSGSGMISCLTFILAAIWIRQLCRNRSNPLTALLAVTGLGLAVRVTAISLFLTLLLLLLIAGLWFGAGKRDWRSIARELGVGLLALALGASRTLVNLSQYGSAIGDGSSEQTRFSLLNLIANLKGIVALGTNLNVESAFNPAKVSLSSLGLGANGLIFVLCAIYFRRLNWSDWSWSAKAYAAALAAGFICDASATSWQPWTFPHSSSWIFLAALAVMAIALKSTPAEFAPRFAAAAVLLSIVHLGLVMVLGEGFPGGPNIGSAFAAARDASQLQRKCAGNRGLLSGLGALEKAGVTSGGRRILLLNQAGSVIAPFFGENHANEVELSGSAAAVLERAKQRPYDLIVVSGPKMPEESSLWEALKHQQYELSVVSDFWRIASRSQQR